MNESSISVATRASRLALAQVEEVKSLLPGGITFKVHSLQTLGDRDLETPLSQVEATDFFTREVDELVLKRVCRIAIHAAKDLPEPLPEGLQIVALTRGVDPADSLVFFHELPFHAKIGTSSLRREAQMKKLREDLVCVPIRGTIERRLKLLEEGEIDGLVIAEAALIRLGLTDLPRMRLEGEVHPLQGRLAVVARHDDEEMRTLFLPLHDAHSLSRN